MTRPDGAVVAVDWGTSSLRAWLLGPDGAVLAGTRSADGMGVVPAGGFEPVLRARLAELGLDPEPAGDPLPVVLCGMVGARQGWREAGYIDVPTPLAAIAGAATRVPAAGLDVRILPGLARRGSDRPDVMRGEETQLLGLALHDPVAGGLVAMPGTHSKWVTLEAGAVADFSTVMTGELFAVLSQHSILRHSLGASGASGEAGPAFLAGLADGLSDPAGLAGRLFSIRASSLLSGLGGAEAADRLSGLLVGAEVAACLDRCTVAGPVRLVAGGRLADLYATAIRSAGRAVVPVDADEVVRAGLFHAAGSFWPGRLGSSAS